MGEGLARGEFLGQLEVENPEGKNRLAYRGALQRYKSDLERVAGRDPRHSGVLDRNMLRLHKNSDTPQKGEHQVGTQGRAQLPLLGQRQCPARQVAATAGLRLQAARAFH